MSDLKLHNSPPPARGDQDAPEILSVSQLTARIKDVVEQSFPSVWLVGEISNFSRPASGHCYLTLKDDQAQIRAVLWRSAASRLRFDLTDGLEVICEGHLDVYAPRGSYQLVVRQVQPKGMGALELALRQLRERLAAEGLFDPGRKRPLPPMPKKVAFVTSPTGAAIRDFLEVARRRWPAAQVVVVPTKVQGEGAAREIAAAIESANRLLQDVEVLIVGRGGGSLEDLWAFNEEPVVRAVAGSRIPVVSAVGHEIDVTLCDMAADVRALTPSEAAERVFPDAVELRSALRAQHARLTAGLFARLTAARSRLESLAGRRPFRFPFDRVYDLMRRADEFQQRGDRAIRRNVSAARKHLETVDSRLHALSPLAVLARGYSITLRPDGSVVRDAGDVQVGETILTRLQTGQVTSRVEKCEETHDEK